MVTQAPPSSPSTSPHFDFYSFTPTFFCIEANLGRLTHHFTIHRVLHIRSIHPTNLVNKPCRPTREGAAAAEAVAIVAEAVAIVVEVVAIVAEVVATVAEVVATVVEVVAIVADAAATTTGAEEQDVATSSLEVVPRALMEGRCPFEVVHQATAPAAVVAVAASREADRVMFNLAYTCKSNSQGNSEISRRHLLTSTQQWNEARHPRPQDHEAGKRQARSHDEEHIRRSTWT